LSTLLLDPLEESFVSSREASAVYRRNRSLEVDRSTTGVLPFTPSLVFDYNKIDEAEASAARASRSNERIHVLFASERGPVDVGYKVAMRFEVGMSGLGEFVDDAFDHRHVCRCSRCRGESGCTSSYIKSSTKSPRRRACGRAAALWRLDYQGGCLDESAIRLWSLCASQACVQRAHPYDLPTLLPGCERYDVEAKPDQSARIRPHVRHASHACLSHMHSLQGLLSTCHSSKHIDDSLATGAVTE